MNAVDGFKIKPKKNIKVGYKVKVRDEGAAAKVRKHVPFHGREKEKAEEEGPWMIGVAVGV